MILTIKARMRRALRAWGLVLRPLRLDARYLRSYGFAVRTVFDVGVNRGTPFLYEAFAEAKFVLIDPLAEAQANATRWRGSIDYDFHEVAVSDSVGEAELTIPRLKDRTAFGMTTLHRRIAAPPVVSVETRKVRLLTLDEIASTYAPPFGLKIDTEGHESAVLGGAEATLRATEFVILEMSLCRRFEDTPPPSHIIETLARHGLEFRDVLGYSFVTRDDRRPCYIDALFTRWR